MNPESLSTTALVELNRVCEAFRDAWDAGRRPRIDDYLGVRSGSERTALFQILLGVEIDLRTRSGERPNLPEYEDRFPLFVDVVRSIFNRLERNGDDALVAPITTEPAPENYGQTTEPPHSVLTDATLPEMKHGAPLAPYRPPGDADTGPLPEFIGRYKVERLIGRGNFVVYLACDPNSGLQVAIKIARVGDSTGRRRMMSLAEEAKKLEGLSHPRIVKVYECVLGGDTAVGRHGFIVLEYIEGETLEQLLRAGRPDPRRLASIVAEVAEAVHHVHTHATGLVHRDLKPSNILLDRKGDPHVCDFGLAIDEEIQRLRRGEVAGTLPYMAPEQVRGETHRLDGRTDIWGLGVILYRGLTGRLPFPGRSSEEVFDEILHRDPKPPRMIDTQVDPELERICLRCLSRPMGERYLTALDLAADLQHWLAGAVPRAGQQRAARVVPKGLLAFDVEDARFFLALLPGPRRADGLPESIRFWKDRIESLDGDKPFAVGLLYGPSGGGKSSFVKAGLLPNLDAGRICAVYLEATPTGTEARLLATLKRVAPALAGEANLADAIAILRDDGHCRPAPKLFIVIDQFEQWLQAHAHDPEAALVRALRQCDGRNVQTLVLVRDDFWMAVTRFLRAIEVPLVQGGNAAAVEPLDAQHARAVLEEFGRALGRITSQESIAGDETSLFLDDAVKGLTAPAGRVIPVRLSLFAEVVRHRPWTQGTLFELGGVDGIGVKFLEDRFESEASPYRLHRAAAQAILRALLPPEESVIRGAVRTRSDLLSESGYGGRPGDFDDLMRVLDIELRLVAPTDAAGSSAGTEPEGAGPESPAETHYQLAHDYLIRPVRRWLDREERSTRAGRARLRLEAITASWLARPSTRRLPSLLEWCGILWHVPSSQRSPDEKRLMRAAAWNYLTRFAGAALFLFAAVWAINGLRNRDTARSLLREARAADLKKLRALIPELEPYRNLLSPDLETDERAPSAGDRGFRRELAGILLYRFAPTSERGRYLRELLLAAPDPDRLVLIGESLAAHRKESDCDALWQIAGDRSCDPGRRLRAVAALALLDAGERRGWNSVDPGLARAVLAEDRGTIPRWIELLDPMLAILIKQLDQDVRDPDLNPFSREVAAEALVEALGRRGADADFAGPIAEAPPDAFRVLVRGIQRFGRESGAIDALRAIVASAVPFSADEKQRELHAGRQANAAIALYTLGHPELVWPGLRHHADPQLRSFLIDRLGVFDVSPQPLIDHLGLAVDPIEQEGVILALGEIKSRTEMGRERALSIAASHLISSVRTLYLEHPDPAVHSASELLLRRFGRDDLVRECDLVLRRQTNPPKDRGWELGPNDHTLVVIRGPLEFRMGSPSTENGRFSYENQHVRRINRSLAVGTKEVTLEQYRRFDPGFVPEKRYTHEQTCPMNLADYFHAAAYCNWLSQKAGIDPSQWCYPATIGPGMVVAEDAVERYGYRLPTEAEWEHVCRVMTETAHSFGERGTLFARYAWTWLNSDDQAHPVGTLLPNELGLFDTLGNVWEWCHDGPLRDYPDVPHYASGTKGAPAIDRVTATTITSETQRLLRGGAFDYSPLQSRSAHRYAARAAHLEGTIGFRVVRTLPHDATDP
jgi:formylglycine-generating enzyme required for sulfatase activity